MDFEYDSEKSASNLDKHGIDFEEAQELWTDPEALVVPARSSGEARFALIGFYRGRIWTCIFTVRDGRVRIISARRSRHGEEERYHQR